MEKFEYTDNMSDRLTIEPKIEDRGAGFHSGVFFTVMTDEGSKENVFVEPREAVEKIRDLLSTWLEETEPQLPTRVGAVIRAALEVQGERVFTRMSGGGLVWHDTSNGALYADGELGSFEVLFEGVSE